MRECIRKRFILNCRGAKRQGNQIVTALRNSMEHSTPMTTGSSYVYTATDPFDVFAVSYNFFNLSAQ